MRQLSKALVLVGTLAIAPFFQACRTNGEAQEVATPEPQASQQSLTDESASAPLLKKVVGDLTRDYAENRYEVCTLLGSDVEDMARVKVELAKIKMQELADAFILTPVIPSIQYFGYLGGEELLLSEISDKKRRVRIPTDEQGNPSFDYLIGILDAKCGEKDARP